MKGKRLFVLSIDSLVDEDMAFAATLPALGQMMRDGAHVRHVLATYPTLTYPVHASIITGVSPARHGVYHNEIPVVGRRENDWFWYRKDMHATTVLDAARAKGMSTGAVFWATLGGDGADYVIPELRVPTDEATQRAVFASGTTPLLMDTVYEKRRAILDGNRQDNFDRFSCACIEDVIRLYKPEVMFCHLQLVDHWRHAVGVQGEEVRSAVRACDGYLSRMIAALKDAGVYEYTNLFVVSDHGHLPVRRHVALNAHFVDEGLITLNDDGEIVDWQAYCHGASLSAQVHLAEPGSPKLLARVESVLRAMATDPRFGIEWVFTAEEARRSFGLAGPFSFVLEATGGTYFKTDWNGPVERVLTPDQQGGSHGHLPTKGMQPVLIACGPDIRRGACIERASVLDEAPTFAELLGLSMPGLEGRVLHKLLNDA